MKIIHVTHCYHPSQGGVQWFFKNISERLVKDYGDDVTVVTTDSMYGPERLMYKKIEPSTEEINGVKVLRFSYSRLHIKPLKLMIKALHKLKIKVPEAFLIKLYGPLSASMKRYLLDRNVDAICGSSSNYYYMQLPLWKACKFFYFGSIHLDEDSKHPVLSKIQKKSIEASTLYIANTYFEKQQITSAGIAPGTIKVIGVGVNEHQFDVDPNEVETYRSSLHIESDAIVIAYAGRIERTKNVKLLVDAFATLSLNHSNLYLLIAGAGGKYANELKEYANQLPGSVKNKIRWKIDFDTAEKASIFHSMDILVLPSSNESFGIVFLEAWVCKKPVIGTAIGAVKDVISENEDGLLMEVNNENSLCEKLSILISNNELRKSMGEFGYRKVMENYTWDIITKKMRECYLGNYTGN